MYSVLKKPVVSEKSKQAELTGTYVFIIDDAASKTDVKNAFTYLYGQTPTSVRIAKNHEKLKFAKKGGQVVKRASQAKAYVTVKEPITNFAKVN